MILSDWKRVVRILTSGKTQFCFMKVFILKWLDHSFCINSICKNMNILKMFLLLTCYFYFLSYQDIYSQHCWVWWLTLSSPHLGDRKIAMSWRPGLVTVWDAVPQDISRNNNTSISFCREAYLRGLGNSQSVKYLDVRTWVWPGGEQIPCTHWVANPA